MGKENVMIRISSSSEGNVLVLEAEGKLTDRDYKDVLIPRLESIIREYGKARLLLDMGEPFHGWEGAAMWDDARFGLAHRNDFEKMGVVGGPKWVDWGMRLASLLMGGDIRSFSAAERRTALEWIKA